MNSYIICWLLSYWCGIKKQNRADNGRRWLSAPVIKGFFSTMAHIIGCYYSTCWVGISQMEVHSLSLKKRVHLNGCFIGFGRPKLLKPELPQDKCCFKCHSFGGKTWVISLFSSFLRGHDTRCHVSLRNFPNLEAAAFPQRSSCLDLPLVFFFFLVLFFISDTKRDPGGAARRGNTRLRSYRVEQRGVLYWCGITAAPRLSWSPSLQCMYVYFMSGGGKCKPQLSLCVSSFSPFSPSIGKKKKENTHMKRGADLVFDQETGTNALIGRNKPKVRVSSLH